MTRENLVVTARHTVIASAVAAIYATGCSRDVVKSGEDCASLLAQYDQGVSVASAESVRAATAARDQGEKICLDGRTEEGTAKLIEAIAQIAAGDPNVPGSPS